jgi:hypothetical protein
LALSFSINNNLLLKTEIATDEYFWKIKMR